MPARARIVEEIAAAGGWLSFARYMQLALHEPGVGYYASSARKFGPGGDFVTAPELGSLFGRTFAGQLRGFERVIEIGAGSGALADVLTRELECEYWVLETRAELRARQRERLGNRERSGGRDAGARRALDRARHHGARRRRRASVVRAPRDG